MAADSQTKEGSIPSQEHPPHPLREQQKQVAEAIERNLPSTFRTSLSSWWSTSKTSGVTAEDLVLKRAGLDIVRVQDFVEVRQLETARLAGQNHGDQNTLYQSASSDSKEGSKRLAYVGPVKLDEKGHRTMNTLYIPPRQVTRNEPKSLVIMHGYGAGLGLFFESMTSVAKIDDGSYRVFYVDWPGMGRSTRPPFLKDLTGKGKNVKSRVEKAEEWFIGEKGGLEGWRRIVGLRSFTLAGHSMGGYLSAAYALRFPERVDRLLLISPVGIPRDPHAPFPYEPASSDSRNGNEDVRTEASNVNASASDPEDIPLEARVAAQAGGREEPASEPEDAPRPRSRRQKLLHLLWENNVSPFSLLRVAGPFGPMMVSRYSARRFHAFDQATRYELHDYLWHILAERGSGEFGITHLLAPGAYARLPLCERMQELKMPVGFVYGSTDWMDASGGITSCERMGREGNNCCGTYIVDHAGHHVYLDNPFSGFVSWLAFELGSPLKKGERGYDKQWHLMASNKEEHMDNLDLSRTPGPKAPHQTSASVRLMAGKSHPGRYREPSRRKTAGP